MEKLRALNSQVFGALDLSFFKSVNPQLFQTFAIGNLLLVGGKTLGYVDIDWLEILLVFSVILFGDFFLKYYTTGQKKFPFSSINSGIGICLFLRTSNIFIYAFAAFFAVVSKYFINIGGKHFFNPSYTAIFVCVVLFPMVAFINPLQWGSDWKVLFTITTLGSIVMWRVGFLDAVVAFFVSFFVWLHLFTTYSFDDALVLYLTGSFFIQMFFGLTDPATIPRQRYHRILFVVQISLLFFIYRLFINENYSFFAAYATVQCLEIWLWQQQNKNFMGYNARNFWQTLITVVIFLVLMGFSLQHYYKYYGVWPEVLTNRCTQIFCKPLEVKFEELFGR